MKKNKKIKIMIVDNLQRVRQDLRVALELIEDFEVVCEAADGEEAILQAEVFNPDIVLMDLNMPVMNGFDATLQTLKAQCPVIGH